MTRAPRALPKAMSESAKYCEFRLFALGEQVADFFEQHFLARRWRRGRGRWLLERIDCLDYCKQNQCDDQEVERRLHEGAIFDQHFLAGRVLAEAERHVAEIEAADGFAEDRHEQIPDQ